MDMSAAGFHTEEDYYNISEDIRCELINGNLIRAQAAPSRIHQKILGELHSIIHNYIQSKGGSCEVYPAPFAVNLAREQHTIVEPDISVICDPDKLTDKGCTGSPDWIIEIVSPSTKSYDYFIKLNLYKDAGVREYWIVDPISMRVLVYHMEEDDFDVKQYTFHDAIKVNIYDDLTIDFRKLSL